MCQKHRERQREKREGGGRRGTRGQKGKLGETGAGQRGGSWRTSPEDRVSEQRWEQTRFVLRVSTHVLEVVQAALGALTCCLCTDLLLSEETWPLQQAHSL